MIHERGRLTVAAFMDLALYDPAFGYYARAAHRTGRAGDFFTSVDVGPMFGDLLEVQIAEMADVLNASAFDLVEAGASNGRLAADMLDAMRRRHPPLYARTALHLVESSPAARTAQQDVLSSHREHLAHTSPDFPESFEGVVVANELFDAMPVHQVVMRDIGLQEIYVECDAERDGALVLREGPLSTSDISAYFSKAGVTLQPGWRVEVNLAAREWIREVAARLRRGFLILIDYGHEAAELYSGSHADGTLTTYSSHQARGADKDPQHPAWLDRAGEQDITAHVDFTSLRTAATEAGLTVLGYLDQTYFLMSLLDARQFEDPRSSIDQVKDRLALKTLLMPGGLGSTMKVLLLGKNVGDVALRGCTHGQRVT